MKSKSLFILFAILIIALSSFGQETGTFTDSRDGKVYKTVIIGTQTWMAENLAYDIPGGCLPYNSDSTNIKKYGLYYYWDYAKDACPKGWHIPTLEEWAILSKYLGGKDKIPYNRLNEIPAPKLVAVHASNEKATNSSGFTAILGGHGIVTKNAYYLAVNNGLTTTYTNYGPNDGFYSEGDLALFWTMNEKGKRNIIWLRTWHFKHCDKTSDWLCSIRCVKD